MTIDTRIQTFFEGHGDHDSFHYVSKDGTRRCGKCGDPMGAFDKIRIRGGPADKCLQCKQPVADLKAIETPSGLYCSADCVANHARAEIKTAMTPVGERPAKRALKPDDVQREEMRVQLAAQIMDHARKMGVAPSSFNLEDAVDAAEKGEIEMLKAKIAQRAEALGKYVDKNAYELRIQYQSQPVRDEFNALKKQYLEAKMNEDKKAEEVLKRSLMTQGYGTFQGVADAAKAKMAETVAQKLAGLSPDQVKQARARAVEALEVALFHTDAAVQAHLLMDPKFDDPAEARVELNRLWSTDANGWRSDAAKRAVKMVEIMDAHGKRALRGP